jgi:hypothetical protein
MIWPLLESLKATVPLLPRALFTRPAVTEILGIARAVRGSVDVFGFECRLSEKAERVDLGVRLLPAEEAVGGIPGRRTACHRDGPGSWLRAFTGDPARFRQLVSYVYFEYDADGSRRSAVPSVFLLLGSSDERKRLGSHHAEVKGLLIDLMGQARFAACERTLARCFAELPPAGRIVAAGALLGRLPRNARVSVSLPRDRVGGYLSRLGWTHWNRDISGVMHRLGDPGALVIDFDVGAAIGPTVAMHFRTGGHRADARLLRDLVDLGLCTPAKRRALLAWPRIDVVRLWKRGWPCRFERYLNHIKTTCAGGEVSEAKAYLGVAPGFSLFRPPKPS